MAKFSVQEASAYFKKIKDEFAKVIIGQNDILERIIIALIADGHLLLEGVPGLAKTKMLTTLAQIIGCKMNRVQFTPDLLPSDLIGTEIYNPSLESFVVRKGPIFTNFLLADEINRAPAKVQSALLQAMQERQVTIGEATFNLTDPFVVLATQNPIEQEGTYPLPEAQLDRFLMKIKVNYPSVDEELKILTTVTDHNYQEIDIDTILSDILLKSLRETSYLIYVDNKIDRYIVDIVRATRDHKFSKYIEWGASPRGSIALKICSRAHALLNGAEFVEPDDVKSIAFDVLRHRINPSFEAEAEEIDSDQIIENIITSVKVP